MHHSLLCFFFFFNDTATTEIYTLSLHDALPILGAARLSTSPMSGAAASLAVSAGSPQRVWMVFRDRKSTRLNSSHSQISYAVFCLKKKKTTPPLPSLSSVILQRLRTLLRALLLP